MSGGNLTILERDALSKILTREFGGTVAQKFIEGVTVKSREFSSSDNQTCIGVLTSFNTSNVKELSVQSLGHHYDLFGKHPFLDVGADFILYAGEDRSCFSALEISFFEQSLLIEEVVAEKHRFILA